VSQIKPSESRPVSYDAINVDPKINTRQLMLASETRDLANSIIRRGLIQPLALWKDPESQKLYIVSGNRRYAAIGLIRSELSEHDRLTWSGVPCIVHFYPTKEEAILANIDSDEPISRVRRCDLAERYAGLAEKYSYAEVSEKTGVPEYEIKYFVETWRHLDPMIRAAWTSAPSAAREIPMTKLYAWSKLPVPVQLTEFERYQSESGVPYLAAKNPSKLSPIRHRRRRSLKVISRQIEKLLASEGMSDIEWGALQMARWSLGLTESLDLERLDKGAPPVMVLPASSPREKHRAVVKPR
jgi:hypothetical protein